MSTVLIILSLIIISPQGEMKVARLQVPTLELCAARGTEFASQQPSDLDAKSLAYSCTVIDQTKES